MTILDAAFWAVCLVLVASGTTKVLEPAAFGAALAALAPSTGGGRGPGWVRPAAVSVGVGEIVLGVAALAIGGTALARAVAVLYVAFVGIVLLARSRGLASCGCFGSRSGPPSPAHAAVNALSALVALAAAALDGAPAVADGLDGRGWVSVPILAGVVGLAGVIIVVDTR